MLGGGLLPGTLAVVYGATGIGKTHLGLTFAHHGRSADGAPGLVFDMNGRGDSQQHHESAQRLFAFLRQVGPETTLHIGKATLQLSQHGRQEILSTRGL